MKDIKSNTFQYVYDGRQCCGFIISRGKEGFEAFNAGGDKSLGVFPSAREAAAATMVVP